MDFLMWSASDEGLRPASLTHSTDEVTALELGNGDVCISGQFPQQERINVERHFLSG
jgi:hypothetical protein